MEGKKKSVHIAMFPWLAHGHIMPFLELSKLLAEKGHRISFISTPKNIEKVSTKIPETLSNLITLVSIPLPHVAGLPHGTESTSELPIHKVPFLKQAYDNLQLGLTRFLTDSDVTWIVNDFASHWLTQALQPLAIGSIFFSIFSAKIMLFWGPPEELLSGYRCRPEDFTVAPTWMDSPGPDAVAYKLYEITSHWDCMDPGVNDSQRLGEAIQGSRAVISRTCPEFESDSLSRLRTIYRKPVLPIGVLPPRPEEHGAELHSERWDKIRTWLGEKEADSVVYIALGTELSLSRESMAELASGVEKSGMPFVWVVNDRALVERSLGEDIIPTGFESRVSGQGLVWRGWAPQVAVLGHPSVGGFLTHCGWSSVIEALSLGRALILFPGGSSDQGLVARMLNGRGIGLEVPRDDEKTGSFRAESVAGSIRRVMVDPEGEPLREKARSMRGIFGNFEIQKKQFNAFEEFVVNNNN